jgi:hypothetical protein
MKQKRYRMAAVAAVLAMAFLTGCGSSAADTEKDSAVTADETSGQSVDIGTVAQTLVDSIEYEDELTQLTEEELSYYVTLEDGVTGVMYMSSGSTAEEVAVFEAPDSSTAELMKGHVEEYLADQRDSFEKYIPEEAERIDDAVVQQNGNYVVLCVSGDSDKAKSLISEAFAK